MSQFKGQYSLMFVMPAPSRAYFRTLSPAQQIDVRKQVTGEIRNTIDVSLLNDWKWSADKITADTYGMKPDADIRQELGLELTGLGEYGNVLSLPDDVGPVMMDHDKQFDCGVSYHVAYSVYISRPWEPTSSRPWIIASPTYPAIIFEMRVEMTWVVPGSYTSIQELIVPFKSKVAGKAAAKPEGTARRKPSTVRAKR